MGQNTAWLKVIATDVNHATRLSAPAMLERWQPWPQRAAQAP